MAWLCPAAPAALTSLDSVQIVIDSKFVNVCHGQENFTAVFTPAECMSRPGKLYGSVHSGIIMALYEYRELGKLHLCSVSAAVP